MNEVKAVDNPNLVNVLHCDLPTLASIQHELVQSFPSTKFRYCKKMVVDIPDKAEQREIAITEHNRAHREAQENCKQILEEYYFPKMNRILKEIVANCKICTRSKYDRHPKKQFLGETPVPSHSGERLHIDIFSTDKKQFLTCVDKLSKFAIVQPIVTRTIADVRGPIIQAVNFFQKLRSFTVTMKGHLVQKPLLHC